MVYRGLLICFLFCVLHCRARKAALRIYGGKDADMRKYPYAVAMEMEYSVRAKGVDTLEHAFFCSATAISPTWTLTAGHCIQSARQLTNDGLRIVIRYNITGEPERKQVQEIIHHPNMGLTNNLMAPKNDIGLLKTDIQLPFYAKLSSVDYTILIGQESVYLGYGLTRMAYEPQPEMINTLKMMDVMISKCDRMFTNGELLFCTAPRCGLTEFTCPGDSGGTVLHSSGVVGVHSSGIRCNLKRNNPFFRKYNYAGISVPVSPYLDWIRMHIKIN